MDKEVRNLEERLRKSETKAELWEQEANLRDAFRIEGGEAFRGGHGGERDVCYFPTSWSTLCPKLPRSSHSSIRPSLRPFRPPYFCPSLWDFLGA